MLHELLLALSGYTGDIFVKDENNQIEVAKGLPFIHPTEVALLNRICKIATHHLRLLNFIQKYNHVAGGGAHRNLYGLYARAFCQGLQLVLDPFQQKLLSIEKELLVDPHLTAAYVQSQLEEYQVLFVALNSIIEQVDSRKVHGCNLLEVLHKASVSGTPVVTAAVLRMQHVCHGVLMKQLSSWMLHGMLLDKYGEFFIHKKERKSQDGGGSQGDEADEIAGITGKQFSQALLFSGDQHTDWAQKDRYSLHAEMLPSYIPTRVAEKILFVGESVQLFESRKGKNQRFRGSILHGKEDEFARELHHLSQEKEFNLLSFEGVIDKIRSYVAEHLWKLVVEESGLMTQLRIMKDFFLLGRGELFQVFIDQAQPLLRVVPVATTQHDVNAAFQQAARNVLFDNEKILQKFSLLVDYKESARPKRLGSQPDAQQQGEIGWNSLQLKHEVEWPLHILLDADVLARYNGLFMFLLYVKRVQSELQQCWALQMHRKHMHTLDVHSSKWWLRNHMAFLVDNLQYYLQVDVIESQFTILHDKIHNTRDFEAIRHAHHTFLTKLRSQTFIPLDDEERLKINDDARDISQKRVYKCLCEILDMCHRFCLVVCNAEVVMTDAENAQLEEIGKEFVRQSNLLFLLLSSARSHQSSPHLAQLLLRVDYNKYFTQAGGKLGSYSTTVPNTAPTLSSRRT